jgi:hypothetical protein
VPGQESGIAAYSPLAKLVMKFAVCSPMIVFAIKVSCRNPLFRMRLEPLPSFSPEAVGQT